VQVTNVVMATMQLVLSQFKNFLAHQLRIESGLSPPKIISKCCKLAKLSHINHSGPVFFETQCIFHNFWWQFRLPQHWKPLTVNSIKVPWFSRCRPFSRTSGLQNTNVKFQDFPRWVTTLYFHELVSIPHQLWLHTDDSWFSFGSVFEKAPIRVESLAQFGKKNAVWFRYYSYLLPSS